MLPTSKTYNFQSIQIELIIREAFERIGISGELIDPVKLESAKRSIDLLFLDWMNKSVNLWTIKEFYSYVIPLKGKYTLDSALSDIIQINLRTSTRVITSDGVAASTPDTGGIAANAFDGNPLTACTQTAPNGWISYTYAVDDSQQINFIGITSATTQEYTLKLQITTDGIGVQQLIPVQTFTAGVIKWFDISQALNATEYRIEEIGGATLNIEEIYFNNNIVDMPLSNVSRDDYYSYSNKYQAGRPSIYYLDRQIQPVLNLWPIPTADYNCLQISYKKMIQDTGSLYTNTVEIPSRFYPALIWGISWQLAIKFNPQAAQMFKSEYEQSFEIATVEDSESTPLSIRSDNSSYMEY